MVPIVSAGIVGMLLRRLWSSRSFLEAAEIDIERSIASLLAFQVFDLPRIMATFRTIVHSISLRSRRSDELRRVGDRRFGQ